MNLMPPVPPGKRYFRLGLTLILLWLAHFAFLMGWLFNEKYEQAIRLEEGAGTRLEAFLEARDRVTSHQRFMKRYGPEVGYRESVEELEKERILWAEGLRLVNDKLPAGVELFQVEAEGRRMDGWAVFPSLSEAAAFMEKLKKDDGIEQISLDCLGKNCVNPPPSKKITGGAQVLHFHFFLKAPPENKDPANRGTGTKDRTSLPEVDTDVE